MSPEAIRAGKVYGHLKKLAAMQGLTVMTVKEAEHCQKVLEAMHRARILIDAFLAIDGDLETVIGKLKAFQQMPGVDKEGNRILEFLEELKQRRAGTWKQD